MNFGKTIEFIHSFNFGRRIWQWQGREVRESSLSFILSSVEK